MESMFEYFPPISKVCLLISSILSLIVSLHVLKDQFLVFEFNLIFTQKEVQKIRQFWRIFSTFFYFGPISLYSVTQISLLFAYQTYLFNKIRKIFLQRIIVPIFIFSYLFILLGHRVLIQILNLYFNNKILSGCLLTIIIYVWGRKNRGQIIHLFLFQINSAYLSMLK